jgi:tRNA A37 threonylcarbamoyladenosine dehydratase
LIYQESMEKIVWLERTELLIGQEKIADLSHANVLVVGLGGVGSYAVEFLCRAGVGKLTIVDGDIVDITNINRQLQALHATVGQSKSALMEQRCKSINPNIEITAINEFLSPERMYELVETPYDYVLDCIDSVTPKVNLILACLRSKRRFISSMGAGGKTKPDRVKVSDLNKTTHCFFAQEVKRKLKRQGIRYGVKVVFSDEPVDKKSLKLTDGNNFKKSFYGTISYMPALFGLQMSAFVIDKLINNKK